MPLQPLSDTIIVRLDETARPSATPGRERVERGLALEAGPGYRSGGSVPGRVAVRRGDTVYFSQNAGVILSEEEGTVLLVTEREILAIERSEEVDEVPLWVPPRKRTPDGP